MNRLFITFSLLIGLALPAVATATIYISTNLTEPVDTDFLHFYKKIYIPWIVKIIYNSKICL